MDSSSSSTSGTYVQSLGIHLPAEDPQYSVISQHPDLVNEPYTISDTGVRPDVTVIRPYFKFEVNQYGMAKCRVGLLLLGEHREEAYSVIRGFKSVSYTSIVHVYDTYGYDIACSFLKSVYLNPLSSKMSYWLHIYLAGSLAVLQPEFAASVIKSRYGSRSDMVAITLTFCSVLVEELTALEMKKPYWPLEPLQPSSVQLPEEILMKIISSSKVSRRLRQAYLDRISSEPLREGELEANGRLPCVILEDGTYSLRDTRRSWYKPEWRLSSLSSAEWKLQCNSDSRDRKNEAMAVQYSPLDYITAYNNRGCDGQAVVKKLLFQITDEDEMLAWIVQLAWETGYTKTVDISGYADLLELFTKLRDDVILNKFRPDLRDYRIMLAHSGYSVST